MISCTHCRSKFGIQAISKMILLLQKIFYIGILWVMIVAPGSCQTHDTKEGLGCAVIYRMDTSLPENERFECTANSTVIQANWKQARSRKYDCQHQEIEVPIWRGDSDLMPDRLTYTVNKYQNVIIKFEILNSVPKCDSVTEVQWRRETGNAHGWKNATLNKEGTLNLTRNQMNESGLYSFKLLNNDDPFATVAIIRRKCPKDMYGKKCGQKCDCDKGGFCDDVNGTCIYPPEWKGQLCKQKNGTRSEQSTADGKGFQICLPPPYGCSCSHGYKGLLCNTKKDPIKIGVEKNKKGISFSWKKPEDAKGENISYSYEITYRACPDDNQDRNMTMKNRTSEEEYIYEYPSLYTDFQFSLWVGDENTPRGKKTCQTNQGAPTLKIKSMTPENEKKNEFKVDLERNCSKVNGEGLGILASIDYAHKNETKRCPNETLPKVYIHCSSEDPFSCKIQIENSTHNTKYNLTASVLNKIEKGKYLNEVIYTSPSVDPRKPQKINVTSGHDFLTVCWEPPVNCPPTGEIELYKIRWYDDYGSPREDNVTSTEFKITKLQTNVTYTIEVYAKNKDAGFGPPAKATAKTEPVRPSNNCIIADHNSSLNEISIVWECFPSQPDNVSLYYNISCNNEEHSTNNTSYTLKGLKPSREYNLTLEQCIKRECGKKKDLRFFTRPENPQVSSDVSVLRGRENTIQVQLPSLKNSPARAWQYVVVTKNDGTLTDEDIKNISLEEVKKCHLEYDIRDESLKEVRESHRRYNNDTCEEPRCSVADGEYLWIANETRISKDNDHNLELSVNISEGCGTLKDGQEYKITVVTATNSGCYWEYNGTFPISACPVTRWMVVAFCGTVIISGFVAVIFLKIYRNRKADFQGRFHDGQDSVMLHPIQGEHPSDDTSVSVVQDSQPASLTSSSRLSIPPPVPPRIVNPYEDMPILNRISRRISCENIEAHLGTITSSHEFTEDFLRVPKKMDKSSSEGELPANRPKNRKDSTIPYNDNRVNLPLIPGVPFSDYINACFVQVHEDIHNYIVTQWPMDSDENTIDDFWRLVWEFSCQLIVVLANTVENNEEKTVYWPNESSIMVGGMKIVLLSTEFLMEYVIRRFRLIKDDQEKEVKQYHYIPWRKDDIPDNPYGLAQMLKKVRNEPMEGPRIVHCCDGTGRSGTALLALSMVDQVLNSNYLDAPKALYFLRKSRPGLVVSERQYRFAHLLAQELLFGTVTSFLIDEYLDALPGLKIPKDGDEFSKLQEQFRILKKLPKCLTFFAGSKSQVSDLNRNKNILPADSKRIYLKTPENVPRSPNPTYINAIRVTSLGEKNGYVVSEHPLAHTISRIWRLVYTQSIACWTLIHSFSPNDKDYPAVLPEGNEMQVDEFLVTVTKAVDFHHFREYHVAVSCPPCKKRPHRCVVLQMHGWHHTESQPSSMNALLSVLDRDGIKSCGSSNRLFTCKDGYTGCGLMMGLVSVVKRIQFCREIDVYRSALSITYDRPEFIVSEEQYELLHDAVALLLTEWNNYTNIS